MATRAPKHADTDTLDLSPAVPSDLAALTRLSWELGTRVVDDDETTRHSEWTHTGTARGLSIHHATDNTVIIEMRTPAGRQRFYGATQASVESAVSSLDADPEWRRRS